MSKLGMIAAMSMMALAGGIGMAAHPIEAEPQSPRKKRIAVQPAVYRSPRGRLPHIGAKERARYAGWPDGPMHVTGHQRRAQADQP